MTALKPSRCPFQRVLLPLCLVILAGSAAAQSSYHVGTLAGQAGVPGTADGFDLAARFNGPSGVAVDSFGNLYVADAANHLIRKVVAGTREVVTLAGLAGISGSADGVGSAARFNAPSGVAVSPAGIVYVADTYNHTIRVIGAGGIVTTLAGTAGASGATDGTGSGARFLYPYGVAVDAAGVVYVADTFNHLIRRVQSGGVVTTLAGLAGARGLIDGLGAAARFNYPFGLAAEPGGIVHVADSFNHAVRRVDVAGSVSTLAGNGGAGSADGVGGAAQFQQPSGIAVDGSGYVFVADTYNSTIRGIAPGGAVSTLAGLAANVGATDGLGNVARFNQPFGIASGGAGVLYLADTRNHTLRATTPVAAPTITSAASATFTAGLAGNFTVTALGAPAPTFSLVSGSLPSGLNFTSWGVIFGTPASTEGSPFLVTIQASNGVPPAATQVLTLNVAPPPPPVIHGWSGNQSLYTGQNVTLGVSATGTAPLTHQWRKNTVALAGATNSYLTISNVQLGDAGTYDVVVSNGGGSTTSPAMVVTVSVPVPPVILLQPRGAELNTGNVGSFGVSAQGSAPLLYQWRRDGVAMAGATAATLMLGQVNAAHAGSYDVLVSNIAGTVVSQPATLVVHPPILITAQPESVAGYLGLTATFRVTATGTGTPQYQWRRAGVNIAGATSASLVLTDLTAAHAGVFDVVVSNFWGSLTSQPAVLTVADASPVILLPPAGATLAVGGSYTLNVQAGGNHPLTYQWRRNGLALAGATQATLAITNAQTYQSGDYEVIVANARGIVTSPPARLTIVPQVRSFSARLLVGPEGAIGTFTVEGSQPKRLLLRAVGPGLAPFGLAGLLADPRLDVFDASGALIASNDQWSETPDADALADATAAVGAFALSRDSRDSAVLRSFAPGSYTVRATAASGAGGIAYLELHDADLANGPLSTIPGVTVRGRVAPGSGVVIGGMGSNGRGPGSFLLRAVGPALHLPEAVSDPAFLVVRDQALVGLNDNWDTVAAEAAEVSAATSRLGLPPLPAGGEGRRAGTDRQCPRRAAHRAGEQPRGHERPGAGGAARPRGHPAGHAAAGDPLAACGADGGAGGAVRTGGHRRRSPGPRVSMVQRRSAGARCDGRQPRGGGGRRRARRHLPGDGDQHRRRGDQPAGDGDDPGFAGRRRCVPGGRRQRLCGRRHGDDHEHPEFCRRSVGTGLERDPAGGLELCRDDRPGGRRRPGGGRHRYPRMGVVDGPGFARDLHLPVERSRRGVRAEGADGDRHRARRRQRHCDRRHADPVPCRQRGAVPLRRHQRRPSHQPVRAHPRHRAVQHPQRIDAHRLLPGARRFGGRFRAGAHARRGHRRQPDRLPRGGLRPRREDQPL
jgi:hypothetical protein